MFAKIRSKIRWGREAALVALSLVTLANPAREARAEEAVRVYFELEAQAFAMRIADGKVEAISGHGGRVTRQGAGALTAPLRNALTALKPTGGPAQPATFSREKLGARDFFLIVHPRFTLSGGRPSAPPPVREFLDAALALARELPEAEIEGLYIFAFPSSAAEPGERALTAAELAGQADLRSAFAAAPFPARLKASPPPSGLPKELMFSAQAANGQWYLVNYWEGAPFSLAEWLSK
jgi:hypothetical protein